MTAAADVITQARKEGVKLLLSASGTLKAVGSEDVVRRWLPIIRQNKVAIIRTLTAEVRDREALVQEFIEVDGLSLEEARSLAAISIMPRPAEEWLSLIAELDQLIDQYCNLRELSAEARKRIMEARFGQPLSCVPAALEWFRKEVGELREKENGKR